MSFPKASPSPTGAAPWSLRDIIRALGTALLLVFWSLGLRAGLEQLGIISPSPNGRILVAFALEAGLLIPAWAWGPGKYGGGWARLGLRPFQLSRSAVLAIASMAFIMVMNMTWELTRRRLGWPGQPNYLPLFGEGLPGLCLALLLGAVVAPFAEEVFFRGYLYAGLRARWGFGWGTLASAAIFSLVHLVPGVLPPIFFTGIVLAIVFESTGSLWPSIMIHSAINALAFIAAYLAQHLPASA